MSVELNKINKQNGIPPTKDDFNIIDNNFEFIKNEINIHENNSNIHTTTTEKNNWNDKYTKAEIDSKLSSVSGGIPKATETSDGLMGKEMVQQVNKIGVLSTNGITESDLATAIKNDRMQLSEKANQSDVAQLSNPNLIINGDFQIDQKNNYAAKSGTSYVIDRWFMWGGGTPPTLQSTKSSLLWTLGGNDNLIQMIELPARANGKKLMLSFIVKGKSTTSLTITVNDSTSPTNGGTNIATKVITCTDDYQYVTLGIPANNFSKYCRVCFSSTSSNDTIELTEVKVELGSIATPFVPRLYAEELALCQRYYESISSSRVTGVIPPNGSFNMQYPFLVEKRATPFITKSNNNLEVIGIQWATPSDLSISPNKTGFRLTCSLSTSWVSCSVGIGFDGGIDAEIY